MCYWIIPYVIMAVAAGVSYDQAENAEDDQYEAIQDQKKAANEQRRLDEEILAEQRKQSDAQARQASSERVLQADVQLGRLRAVAGESGLQGATQEKIISESAGNAYADLAMIESNRAGSNRQNDLENKGAKQRERNNTAGLRTGGAPSGLAAGLSAAGGMSSHYASTRTTTTTPAATNRAT